MRRVWNWLMLSRVLQITDRVAESSRDVDNFTAEYEDLPFPMSQAIRFAMTPFGMYFPELDSQTIAATRQYGATASPDEPRLPGSILVMADGRLAMALDKTRTIEPAGGALCIVAEPEAGRYVEAWELPGVVYLGGGL